MTSKDNHTDAVYSIFTGLKFRFAINQKELLYLASAWSGKESVYYDGLKISTLKSYSKKTSHQFEINGIPYEAKLIIDSLWKRSYHCCLYRQKKQIKCFDLYYKDNFWGLTFNAMLTGFSLRFIPKSLWFVYVLAIIWLFSMPTINSKKIVKVRLGRETN